MGIADLFRPKYRHSDVRVRTEAVRALGTDDMTILERVAKTDRDAGVRRIAIEKLDEAETVAAIAASETERGLRELASERAAQLWTTVACGDDADDAQTALAGIIRLGASIASQSALVDIAVRASQAAVRKRAFGEVRDPRALAELAKSDAAQDVRVAAVGRIDDGDVLRAVAIEATTKEVGLAAVDKLDDADRLEQVAQKAKTKAVRQRARKIVTEMAEAERAAKPTVPDDVKRRRAEKSQLVREVEAVADSFDFVGAVRVIKRAEDAWSKLAADDGDERFVKATARFWKRHELHAEQARTAEELRAVEREAAAQRAAEAERQAQDRERIAAEQGERDRVAAERAAKVAAVTEKPADRPEQAEHIDRRQEEADRRKEEAERGASIAAALTAMLDDMDKATTEPGARGLDRLLDQARKVFEQLGRAPAAEREALADRYAAARGKLMVKQSEAREAEDWARWSNVPKAEALIATARQFLDEEGSADLGNRLRQLQALWKEVGPMPQRRSKELWEQFKASCDQVYDKVKAFRAVEHERFGEVAKVKEALIAEAELLAGSEDLIETAMKIKELQARWKESGHLPRKQGDELWKRFRGACDRFFERRKPMIDAQRAAEAENLAKKLSLIARARDIAAGSGAIAEVREVQRVWKEIGYVPRRDAERVYRDFRAACDAVFARRNEARDAGANAYRVALNAVKGEIAEVTAAGAFDDGAAMVARAIAVRAKVAQLDVEDEGVRSAIAAMIKHVVVMFGGALAGTELDLGVARSQRAKLIAKAEELLPRAPTTVAAGADDVAAQLKQAMRANAFGTLRWSGRDPIEVVDELRAAWRDAGPMLDDADREQLDRFELACEQLSGGAGVPARRKREDRRPDADARKPEAEARKPEPEARTPQAEARTPEAEATGRTPAAAAAAADAVPAVVQDPGTTPAMPPPPPPAIVPAKVQAEPAAPLEIPSTAMSEATTPLGLAGLHDAPSAQVAKPEVVAEQRPPAVDVVAPPPVASEAAAPPQQARGKSLTQPPPMDEVDEGWDLGDDDPTASSTDPPSATEMAGDGATGGDGIADDPGWD